jgi:hypothetical protein
MYYNEIYKRKLICLQEVLNLQNAHRPVDQYKIIL